MFNKYNSIIEFGESFVRTENGDYIQLPFEISNDLTIQEVRQLFDEAYDIVTNITNRR